MLSFLALFLSTSRKNVDKTWTKPLFWPDFYCVSASSADFAKSRNRWYIRLLQLPRQRRPQRRWRRPWGCCPWLLGFFRRFHLLLHDSQNPCRTTALPHDCFPLVPARYHIFLPVFRKMWTGCGQEAVSSKNKFDNFCFVVYDGNISNKRGGFRGVSH